MNEIIYKNKEDAVNACKEASDAVWDALDKYSAWLRNDDECVTTYVCVYYIDENGKQQKYSYSD